MSMETPAQEPMLFYTAKAAREVVMDAKCCRTWAEIDLECIRHNLEEIRRLKGDHCEIMAVVKADAYGHGVEMIVSELLNNGVKRFAVSSIDEAIQIRKTGFNMPLQVLSHTMPHRVNEIIDYGLLQTITGMKPAEALSQAASARNTRVKVHIKIDTGMGRLGFKPEEAVERVSEIYGMPGIEIEGIMTHFSSSDETDPRYTFKQFEKFMEACDKLKKTGIHIRFRHAANSAAVIKFPEMHLDMIRPGIMLYGIYPSGRINKKLIDLRPAMSLKTRIINIGRFTGGMPLSYGRTFETERESIIAVVPVGYADGYPRILSNMGRVLVGGMAVPQTGTICMDHLMTDVTGISRNVEIGDEVVIFGQQGKKIIPVDEVAVKAGTIPYEIVCKIGVRVPRVYTRNGNVIKTYNYLDKLL